MSHLIAAVSMAITHAVSFDPRHPALSYGHDAR